MKYTLELQAILRDAKMQTNVTMQEIQAKKRKELSVYLNIFLHRLGSHKSDSEFREKKEEEIKRLHNLLKTQI